MESQRRVKNILSEKGQATIEAVLLAIILTGAFMAATQRLREKQTVQKFAEKSVGYVKNMSTYGTWKEGCKPLGAGGSGSVKLANCHPNSINRALSSAPE